ncbi:aldehyde dehydrogenase family protein [Jannaschia sp. W003]|uniref:aldehyde dehydrogenase family protein n=1 Tax=Jannaschia sp. W003 TaxID=2867012 RepID=UPI0021A88EDA|nr:aldehyde dehydrogenase family protein [Jannaschia sp. W003]UWQ22074.1 aldehyde dehydrogenase family protein [Jannaschia sp. W003]
MSAEEARRVHARLTGAFSLDAVPDLAARRARLTALGRAIGARQDALVRAVSEDFRPRAESETLTAELAFVQGAIRHTLRHLRRWTAPRRDWVLQPLPGRAETWMEPKGVVGVFSPWNYPIQLALVPLVTAVAAGNRALLKPSERAPHSSEALAALVADVFPEDEAAVVLGGPKTAQALTALPFGHIFFTGSTATGRLVARAAAETLSPVTLELGGRSPAVALPGADPAEHAPAVAWGRWLNAGQTCVAPNHLWVPRGTEGAWADALMDSARGFLPRDYTGMIDPRAGARVRAMLDEARAAGAEVRTVEADVPVPPSVVLDPPRDGALMREEIFGPVLPILPYDAPEDVLRAEAGGTPLAAYVFGEHGAARRFLARMRSGGGAVNAAVLHLALHDRAFGGIGQSGHGAYHGERGFREFSHERTVFTPLSTRALRVLAPPYPDAARRLFRRMGR